MGVLRPPSYDGWQSQLFLFTNLTLGNVETAALLFLISAVNQNKRSVFWKWSLLSVVTLAAIFLFTAAALGDYAKSQRFPFYTVTKIAEVSIFQRWIASCWLLGVYHVGSSGFIFRGIRKIPGTDDAEKSLKICSSRLRGTGSGVVRDFNRKARCPGSTGELFCQRPVPGAFAYRFAAASTFAVLQERRDREMKKYPFWRCIFFWFYFRAV